MKGDKTMTKAVKFGKISLEDLLKKSDTQLDKELARRNLCYEWGWGGNYYMVYLDHKIENLTRMQKVQMLIQYDAYYRGQNDLLIEQRKKKREKYGTNTYLIERNGKHRKFKLTEDQAQLILWLAKNG